MSRLKSWLQQTLSKIFNLNDEPPVETAEVVEQTELEVATETQDVLTTQPVAPVTEVPPTDTVKPEVIRPAGVFQSGWMTDVGRVRGHNEDAVFVFVGEQASSNAVPPFGLFLLADGMGGHQAGEAASSLSVREASSHLVSQIYLPLLAGTDRRADQPSLTETIREAISRANRQVSQSLPGSGSTLTCGMVLAGRLFLGHVGDSRAYLLRDGAPPKQLTQDHSLVKRLVEMGQLTEEEAAVHPQRNVLYRAIGQGGTLEIDILTHALHSGDRLFLCSDGLWGMVEEEALWKLIDEAQTPQEACVKMVEMANVAGGNDNISVILVEFWDL